MSYNYKNMQTRVATISPFKVKSQELFGASQSQRNTDDATAKEAVAIRKLITRHRTGSHERFRLAIARNSLDIQRRKSHHRR